MKRSKVIVAEGPVNVIAQFVSPEGVKAGSALDLPLSFSESHLQELLNELLSNEDPLPYSFYVNDEEVVRDLKTFLTERKISTETTLSIVYQPQAVFRVRPLTRCTSTLPGHTDSILVVAFSPDGSMLASGSGDKTMRLWDLNTQTPIATCVGHTHWVLACAWAPDASLVASGSHDNTIRIWSTSSVSGLKQEKEAKVILRGHKKFVTAIAWQPLHSSQGRGCRRLVSSSKDGQAKIWDVVSGQCLATLSGHSASITTVKWGGEGLIYTASQDRTIIVWAVEQTEHTMSVKVIRHLKDHAHWVNSLALSTDHFCRTGPYDHTSTAGQIFTKQEAFDAAVKRYSEGVGQKKELLVSCSDDFSMFLWSPTDSNKPLQRLVGHQQLVNDVVFSPDGNHIASASFDKSVRLWNGRTGKFAYTFRGHVGSVYSCVFSADSRYLLSASKDSTVKLWDLRTRRLAEDLPGHEDEVYAVDWDPLGGCAASGGKDRVLKIWRGAA